MNAAIAMITLAWCAIFRPHHVACPPGWWESFGPKWPVLVCQMEVKEIPKRGPRGGWYDASPEPIAFALKSYP